MTRPLHSWKLNTPAGPVFVRIFKDIPSLKAGYKEICDREPSKDIAGCHFPMSHKKTRARGSTLLLSAPDIGSGYIAHEVTHAALWLSGAKRVRTISEGLKCGIPGKDSWVKKRYNRDPEEYLCKLVELITGQFWKKWYKYAKNK